MTTVKGISIQQKLYELAKPILILLKVVGYFPYSTTKNFELTFRLRSFALIWSLFLLLLSTTKMVTFIVLSRIGKFLQMTQLAFVDGFCQMLLIMVGISAVVLVTAKGIFSVRKAVDLWHLHYERLEKFTNLGPHFDFCNEFGLYHKLFQRIKRQVWVMAAVSFVYGVSAPAVMHIMNTTPAGTQMDQTKSKALFVKNALTTVMSVLFHASIPISFMYIGLTAYMIFFLKLYNACLKVLGEELQRVVIELEDEQTLKLFTKSLGQLNNPLLSVLISDARMSTLQNCLQGYILIDELVDAFSKHFSFELVVETVKSFVCVLVYAFFILFKGVNFVGLVVCLCPMIALSWRSYGLASEATNVRQSADVILRYLHQMDLDTLSPSLRLKVQMAAMKISTRPPTVMPGHFFTLDRQLLVSIISAMTTYLIILVQFKSTEGSQ